MPGSVISVAWASLRLRSEPALNPVKADMGVPPMIRTYGRDARATWCAPNWVCFSQPLASRIAHNPRAAQALGSYPAQGQLGLFRTIDLPALVVTAASASVLVGRASPPDFLGTGRGLAHRFLPRHKSAPTPIGFVSHISCPTAALAGPTGCPRQEGTSPSVEASSNRGVFVVGAVRPRQGCPQDATAQTPVPSGPGHLLPASGPGYWQPPRPPCGADRLPAAAR